MGIVDWRVVCKRHARYPCIVCTINEVTSVEPLGQPKCCSNLLQVASSASLTSIVRMSSRAHAHSVLVIITQKRANWMFSISAPCGGFVLHSGTQPAPPKIL